MQEWEVAAAVVVEQPLLEMLILQNCTKRLGYVIEFDCRNRMHLRYFESNMIAHNYCYQLIQVEKTADEKEIKKAYRKLGTYCKISSLLFIVPHKPHLYILSLQP
jgi:hypothetical protein